MSEGRHRRPTRLRGFSLAFVVVGIGFVVPVACPRVATAAEAIVSVAVRAKARRAAQDGEACFARGDLPGALAAFVQSATLFPMPSTLRDVARTLDALGRIREAVAAYDAYIAACGTAYAAERETAGRRALVLRASPGHMTLRGSPGETRVTVDGAGIYEGLPLELDLAPGEHVLRLEARGFGSQDVVLVVDYASTMTPAVDLEADAPRPMVPIIEVGRAEPVALPVAVVVQAGPTMVAAERSWAREHTAGLFLAGLAAGAFTVAGVFGAQSLKAQRGFATHPSADAADRGERAGFISDCAIGVGAFLAAASVAFLLPSREAPPTARVYFTHFIGVSAFGATGEF